MIPQRRYVHLWRNGRYHGLYDLNEPPTRETVSAHLLSRLPSNATQAQINQLQPANIEFISSNPAADSPNGNTQWITQVVNPCITARNNPFSPTLFDAAVANLDLPSYIRYISILEYCNPPIPSPNDPPRRKPPSSHGGTPSIISGGFVPWWQTASRLAGLLQSSVKIS